MTSIRQFVPAVYPRDAIGGHVLRLHRQLVKRGIDSSIVVEADHLETAQFTTNVSSLGPAASVDSSPVNVYHMATGANLAEDVMAMADPLVVVHHDLTPLDLLSPWDDEFVHRLTLARRQLETLVRRADLGIGVSEHNRLQLEALGCEHTAVAPLVFDLGPTPDRPEQGPATEPTILFVGRFAPNKAHHDLIAAFGLVCRRWPRARLRLVGGSSVERYMAALRRYVDSLGLTDRVSFELGATDEALAQAYTSADVFCCLSDHEGFGMPLVEAMHHGLPVIAYGVAAVPETVGEAGLVLDTKDPSVVATAIEQVLDNQQLRQRLTLAGQLHSQRFNPDAAVDQFLDALESNISEASFVEKEAQ